MKRNIAEEKDDVLTYLKALSYKLKLYKETATASFSSATSSSSEETSKSSSSSSEEGASEEVSSEEESSA